MATGVVSWSQTAATNASADSTINWAEGQAPSTINDSARALMASAAKYRDDLAGALTTGGTSTAYTLTTNQVFPSLSAMSGQALRVKFDKTNGTSPTLNVDGLNAKALVTVTGTAVASGGIKANAVYDVVYANGSSEWILVGGPSAFPEIPAGTVMLFFQAAAPTGWTKSTANDDKAIRIVSGTGGGTGGSTAFTSVFAARTIAKANLPNYNLDLTGLLAPSGGSGGDGTVGASTGVAFTSMTIASGVTRTVGGTLPSGGSGTAVDFAVNYMDCIVCSKDA